MRRAHRTGHQYAVAHGIIIWCPLVPRHRLSISGFAVGRVGPPLRTKRMRYSDRNQSEKSNPVCGHVSCGSVLEDTANLLRAILRLDLRGIRRNCSKGA